ADHVGRLVVRGVVDDQHLQVAVRLAQGRVEGAGQVAAVVVRGDDHTDGGGHAVTSSRRRVKRMATREVQKRYFPDGSCGMRSTYSQRQATSGPKRSAARLCSRSRLLGPKSGPRTMRKRNDRVVSCTICNWARPGTIRAKFSVSETPEISS